MDNNDATVKENYSVYPINNYVKYLIPYYDIEYLIPYYNIYDADKVTQDSFSTGHMTGT